MAIWPAITSQEYLNSAQQLQCQHRQGNTQEPHTESPKRQQAFFFLTDYVALNFFVGGDDGRSHIMDALLILLVA